MQIGKTKFTIGTLSGFLVGIFLASWVLLDLWWCIGVAAGLIIGLILFWKDVLWRWVLLCLLGLFLGLGYYYGYEINQNQKILTYNQQLTIANAMVVERPEINGTKQNIIVSANKTKILVQTSRYPEYKYSDVLEIKGTIQNPAEIKPFDNFNYGEYLLHRGIRGLIQNPESISISRTNIEPTGLNIKVGFYKIIYFIGDMFRQSLNQILPEPEASLARGLILGDRTLPESLNSAFNRAGVTHIIAVSGYNVTIIISALAILLMALGRRMAFWGSLAAVLIFIILTGAAASVIRAGILAMLASWGKLLGRRPYYPVLILVTAVLMLLFNPYALVSDISFQLSFLAFVGIVFVAPRIGEIKFLKKFPEKIVQIFSETISAQILVLPILIYNFGLFSIIAPVANILILIVVPTAMALVFTSGLAAMAWLGLGKLIGLASWLILKYIIVVAENLSKLSWAAISLKTSEWWWIVLYYAIIILLIKQAKSLKLKAKNNQ